MHRAFGRDKNGDFAAGSAIFSPIVKQTDPETCCSVAKSSFAGAIRAASKATESRGANDMTALPHAQTESGSQVTDLTPCPNCGELLVAPRSSNYLGLGRIEHVWRCDGCGQTFRSTTHLAGMIDVSTIARATGR
jgi:hypothetical protein